MTRNWQDIFQRGQGFSDSAIDQLQGIEVDLATALAFVNGGSLPALNARMYGAKGDGVTDDTDALQAFLDDFVAYSADASKTGTLGTIPPGVYKTTSKLAATFPANNTQTKQLFGYGARILPTVAAGHAFEIASSGGAQVRNLTVAGLMIDGTNHSDTASALLHIDGGATGALYRLALRDITLENFVGHGCLLERQAFETAFYSPRFIAAGSNQTGDGLLVQNNGGAVSSIEIFGGTMSGGLHNIYCSTPQGGIKMFGGTYLSAYNHAILVDNETEGGLWGCHIENAWQGGTASPGWGTNQAGVTLTGRGFAYNVYGTCNNQKMRYVISVFASPIAAVVGGMAAGQVDYYLRTGGAANSQIFVAGIGSGATGTIHDGTPATCKTIRVGVAGNIGVTVDKGGYQSARPVPTYSASVTLDASQGPWQTIVVTDANAFTLNAPTNPPDGSHTQELTVEIYNNSGGAMGTITWNAIFDFNGPTWTNPASTKKRWIRFQWNGSKWVETGRAANDY